MKTRSFYSEVTTKKPLPGFFEYEGSIHMTGGVCEIWYKYPIRSRPRFEQAIMIQGLHNIPLVHARGHIK